MFVSVHISMLILCHYSFHVVRLRYINYKSLALTYYSHPDILIPLSLFVSDISVLRGPHSISVDVVMWRRKYNNPLSVFATRPLVIARLPVPMHSDHEQVKQCMIEGSTYFDFSVKKYSTSVEVFI